MNIRAFHRGDMLAPGLLPDCKIPVEILIP
jgi:hypothetical protein